MSKLYQFGNRPDYYSRRGSRIDVIDPRVLLLEDSLIKGKKVLDLGCHEGVVTLQIAKVYRPAKRKGIDIDYRLINKAVTNWSNELALENSIAKKPHELFHGIPKSILAADSNI